MAIWSRTLRLTCRRMCNQLVRLYWRFCRSPFNTDTSSRDATVYDGVYTLVYVLYRGYNKLFCFVLVFKQLTVVGDEEC